MYHLPEYGTPHQLLKKYSPSQLVIYNEAYFFAVENGRVSGGAKQPDHIDDYYELDVDYIGKIAWVSNDDVLSTIKTAFNDAFDLLEVDKDGKKKCFIKEKK